MIHFFSEGILFGLSDESSLVVWLNKVVVSERQEVEEINYIFCDDEYLHSLNLQYLDHDTLTDVISFQYESSQIRGDVFISIPRVKENASLFNVHFDQELRRVMVHGLLHLLGYKDKSNSDSKKMRAMEDKYLSIIE